jgi:hypothetical protein
MRYLLLLLLVFIVSCYKNETCKQFYIGEFRIDTNIISNPKCLEFVKLYRWDTVKLVSKTDGRYFFETKDKWLKECEGEWWVGSANMDGDCIGHVKQNNLSGEVAKPPFYISIKLLGESYTLPFKKERSR